jgi:hypothetical protein
VVHAGPFVHFEHGPVVVDRHFDRDHARFRR